MLLTVQSVLDLGYYGYRAVYLPKTPSCALPPYEHNVYQRIRHCCRLPGKVESLFRPIKDQRHRLDALTGDS